MEREKREEREEREKKQHVTFLILTNMISCVIFLVKASNSTSRFGSLWCECVDVDNDFAIV